MFRTKKQVSILSAGVVLIVGGALIGFAGHGREHLLTPSQSTKGVSKIAKPLSLTQRERVLQPAQEKQYFSVPVKNMAGKSETLSVKNHPLVFVSDWDTGLLTQLAASHVLQNPPDIIVTWPRPGESLQSATNKVATVLKQLGLTNPVYSVASLQPHQWVTGLPDTYVWDSKGAVVEIPGPLPTNEVQDWTQVFSQKWEG